MEQSGQTNNAAAISRMADIKICPPLFITALPWNDREKYHALKQYDPLQRYTLQTAAKYQAFSKVHR